ncbi:MAG: hypothetical protein MJZ20_07635 [Bacteroidaceae bacterium]|nr:hypothetical protein [Bacteroidaceae bacterium]
MGEIELEEQVCKLVCKKCSANSIVPAKLAESPLRETEKLSRLCVRLSMENV